MKFEGQGGRETELTMSQKKALKMAQAQAGNGMGNGKPLQPRYGGTKQDSHGEWWVLVLAEGRWVRSRELGLRGPAF